MKLSKVVSNAGRIFVVMALTYSCAACGDDKEQQPQGPGKDYLPFSIVFDKAGNPILLDEKGNRIPPVEQEFPISATAIENVESLTIVQYRGSHVQLIKIGGRFYSIPLAH